MPVTDTATSAPSRARAPRAIAARRLGGDRAVLAQQRSPERRARPAFTASAYETIPPRNTSLEPGTDVSRAATSPPVHDSAVASVSPRSRQSSSTSSSIGDSVAGEEVAARAARRSAASSASARASAPGSTNRSTWISKSRAQIVTSTPSPSPPAAASASATADSETP